MIKGGLKGVWRVVKYGTVLYTAMRIYALATSEAREPDESLVLFPEKNQGLEMMVSEYGDNKPELYSWERGYSAY
ncbi:MAG: hypothetical protein ABH879_00645 [archaeon]